MPTYPVLGELARIGDIILQERSNYESRKLVNVVNPTNAAITILKGQVLSGNAVMATFPGWSSTAYYQIGSVVSYLGANYISLVGVANQNQNPSTATAYWAPLPNAKAGVVYPLADIPLGQPTTITVTLAGQPTGGTYQISYGSTGYGQYSLNQDITASLAYNASAATVLAALQQLSPDFAGASVTATPATGTQLIISIPATALPPDGMLPITVWNGALTGNSAGNALTASSYTYQEGTLPQQPASCVSLQQLAIGANSSAQVLVIVREALLKPGYLWYLPTPITTVLASGLSQTSYVENGSAAVQNLANQQLEYYQLMVVTQQPTMGVAQDVDLTKKVALPTQGIQGL